MDYKVIKYSEISRSQWNANIESLCGHLHLVSWENLNYYSAFNKIANKSFLIQIDKQIYSAVPVAINKNFKKHFFGFNYGYCPSPIFKKDIKPSLRRKLYNVIIEELKKIGRKTITKLNLFTHPAIVSRRSEINSKNQFELLSFNPEINIVNTLIMELNKSEDIILSNLSKYHKKNIQKGIKNNLRFNVYDSNTDRILLKKIFLEFKNLHFKSAGRLTRPKLTWDVMYNLILDNHADLFSISLLNKNISFLYCGKYQDYSWGWSQVNHDKYEKKYMPRHLLEWQTILHYKNNTL